MSSDLDALIRAVANSTRRQILALVWRNDLSAGTIAEKIDLAPASVSEHLRVLRKAGWVSVDKQGTSWIYRSNPSAMKKMIEILNKEFPYR